MSISRRPAASVIAASLLVTLLVAACSVPSTPTPTPYGGAGGVIVEVAGAHLQAALADTSETRAQGLSGLASIPENAAMWFDLGTGREAAFWMKDMRFALDIVWVDEGLRVVGVSTGVPVPTPDVGDDALPTYSPGVPVRYVLEVNAGVAAARGIVPGVLVRITPR